MGLINNISSFFSSGNLPEIREMIYTGSATTPAFSIDLDSYSGLKKAYEKCSPVSTIIGKLASAMANGKWWIVDENDNDVKEKATYNLFKSPNPLQSWTELIIQAETLRYIYGEVFLYFSIPFQNLRFDPNNLKGKSRLLSLAYEIENIIQAQEAIYSLNKDRGAQGLLINKKKDETGGVPLKKIRKRKLAKTMDELRIEKRSKKSDHYRFGFRMEANNLQRKRFSAF